jgi:hypothetical protein
VALAHDKEDGALHDTMSPGDGARLVLLLLHFDRQLVDDVKIRGAGTAKHSAG